VWKEEGKGGRGERGKRGPKPLETPAELILMDMYIVKILNTCIM
jgi:hypothetical protein